MERIHRSRDGCGQEPMMGFRWKCVYCKNHDLLAIPVTAFLNGKLLHNNRRQTLSSDLDHEFNVYTEKALIRANDEIAGEEKGKQEKENQAEC